MLSWQNFGYEVRERASIFVPSIGKVTIVVLLRNLLVCFIQDLIETGLTSPLPPSVLSRTAEWTMSSLLLLPRDRVPLRLHDSNTHRPFLHCPLSDAITASH